MTLATQKQEVYDYVNTFLGGGMVDVELDPIHYQTGLNKALTRYRMRSDHAVEESYMFLTTVVDQNDYILPSEIMEVRKTYRSSIGSRAGSGTGGSNFEPFNAAYTNTYLLSGSKLGGLATYDMFAQHQELVGRMFGSFIEFKWNNTSKKLTLLQRPRAEEEILLYCYNYRPDSELLNDYLATQWIKDYTLASCKYMLGEAREKFATIAGPQGGTALNGAQMKAEGQAIMDKMVEELKNYVDGSQPLTWVIG